MPSTPAVATRLWLATLFFLNSVSCSSTESPAEETGGTGGPPASGGAIGSGGALASGGTVASGGAASGGAASGGAASGGAASDGAASGGAASGGADGAFTGGAPGTGGTEGTDPPIVVAIEMAADMGVGTNIGNTLENTTEWETGWGQPLITQAFINGLASRGIRTVRVPVAWDTYANAGVIDTAKINRVAEVVGWIEAAGMYAIVNIHWDGGWIFSEGTREAHLLTASAKTKFTSYWQQISARFANVGHKLIFEGLNEEARFYIGGDADGQPDYAAVNELNQLFVDTVRAGTGYNPTRGLLIAGFATDIEKTCVDDFATPTDPAGPGKLFLSLHYYTPYTFTLMETVESWGSPASTWGTTDDHAELARLFDQAAACGSSKQMPIILGEFAVTRGESYVREPASRVLWMKSVMEGSLARNMVPVLWDTGTEISRVDGAFSAEFQQVMAD